jgi:hypothetical protein
MLKKSLSEQDIRTNYITPNLSQAGWRDWRMREEVYFTDGRMHVQGHIRPLEDAVEEKMGFKEMIVGGLSTPTCKRSGALGVPCSSKSIMSRFFLPAIVNSPKIDIIL